MAGPKFIPLRAEVDGRTRRLQFWSSPPGQRPVKRGKSVVLRELRNLDAENELVLSFDRRVWRVEVNGVDVTGRFRTLLIILILVESDF